MCILIVKPANIKLPDYQTLCRCARVNSHGFGYVTPNRKPFKTLSFDTFIARISQEDEDLPMLIHFRYATHGSIKKSNCHPFRDEKSGVSFAHNGVLHIKPIGDLTDSETAFKYLFVPAIEKFGFGTKNFRKSVNRVRDFSRFAFLSDDGKISKFGKFILHNGCFYSNGGFM